MASTASPGGVASAKGAQPRKIGGSNTLKGTSCEVRTSAWAVAGARGIGEDRPGTGLCQDGGKWDTSAPPAGPVIISYGL